MAKVSFGLSSTSKKYAGDFIDDGFACVPTTRAFLSALDALFYDPNARWISSGNGTLSRLTIESAVISKHFRDHDEKVS